MNDPKSRTLRKFMGLLFGLPERLRSRSPRAYLAAVGILALVFVVALFLNYKAESRQIQLPLDRLQKDSGNAFSASIRETMPFPWILRTTGDSFEAANVSRLKLFENGKALGPAHSPRADIRSKGNGRYSHWHDDLVFSSSDNTDPRLNGRAYTVVHSLSIQKRIYAAFLVLLIFAAFPYYRRHTKLVLDFARQRTKAPTEGEKSFSPSGCARPRRLVVYSRSAARASLIIVFTVGGIEFGSYAYLRIASDLPQEQSIPFLHSPYRGHRLKPAGEYASPDHSPDGFRRDTVVPFEKPAETMRIFALGGSTLYGIGAGGQYPVVPPLSNQETIDHHLQSMINSRLAAAGHMKRVEIINAAVVGYHTFQHLVYVNERLVHYHPDFFLFLDGHNDFYNANEGYNHWLAYPFYSVVVSDMINKPTLLYASYLLFKALPQESNFVTLVLRILHKRAQIALNNLAQNRCCRGKSIPHEQLKFKYKEYAENTYLRAYRQIRVVADQIGAGMMVFVQPEIVLESPTDLSPEDRKLQVIAAASWKGYTESFVSKYPNILSTFDDTGIEVYGLGTIADKTASKDQLYIDYTHLSPAGARVVAELMLDKLWPYVLSWVHTENPRKRWPADDKSN